MLTDKQMDAALGVFQARMQAVTDEYFRRMGEHIRDIGQLAPSDVHRLQQLRRLNRNLADVERQLARAAGMTVKNLETVLTAAAETDDRVTRKILGVKDIDVSLANNAPLRRALRAQYAEAAGRLSNLSNTTVAAQAYRRAVDSAVTAVQSGAEDYESAIRRQLRQAGAMGLRVRDNGTTAVEYESGHTRRVDTAVRMNVLDAMRRMNQRAMEEVGREFGADGVEIDAHMLCAEDHLPYQGLQFTNDEFDEIQAGLARPFGEWNCRHTWHPIIMGVSPRAYTDEELDRFARYSTEEVEIDGRVKTRYEWSQEMRRMETAIREKKDTATLAAAAGDEKLRRECQTSINAMVKGYERLSDMTGLGPDFRRTYVAGFKDAKDQEKTVARNILDSDGNVIFSHNETPEIQNAQSFESIAEYFHYEDKMGHLRPVLNDNMATADLLIVKEIAEGVKWARDVYGLSDSMPRTIKFGDLDKNTVGEYNLHTREITISHDISMDQAFLTAVHEMTHFADDLKGCVSDNLLKRALSNLGVEYGSDEAISLQYGSTHSFEERIYKDPMEILAYSVDYEFLGRTGKLGREMLKMWWEEWHGK